MFHIYLTYRRFYRSGRCNEMINEQYHIEEPDEKTTRKVSCAISGLLQQMSIDHDVNIVYEPDGRC